MNEGERQVAERAARQYGVISRAQALHAGMSARTVQRRVSDGTWEALFPHVYRLPGTPRTGRQRAMAASLWGGPESAISHTTAGRLLRLDGLEAESLHLTVPRAAWLRTDRAVLHRVSRRSADRPSRVDGIPCTSATRTLIDCAAMLGDEALEVAFESARRMGLTSPRALAQRAEALCGSGKPAHAIRAARTSARRRTRVAVSPRGEDGAAAA